MYRGWPSETRVEKKTSWMKFKPVLRLKKQEEFISFYFGGYRTASLSAIYKPLGAGGHACRHSTVNTQSRRKCGNRIKPDAESGLLGVALRCLLRIASIVVTEKKM